jgi:hypothetical protein
LFAFLSICLIFIYFLLHFAFYFPFSFYPNFFFFTFHIFISFLSIIFLPEIVDIPGAYFPVPNAEPVFVDKIDLGCKWGAEEVLVQNLAEGQAKGRIAGSAAETRQRQPPLD